ncbi:MAG: UDP-N-acetylmuramate dehydrogenase [Candidatus Omnitrophica bacterium]|nr:UDP-N-acetylmuramate dehydrogenase [Candidatus Omnitrophota bacterium]
MVLSNYTTIKIGGKVDRFFLVDSQKALDNALDKCCGDFYLLGGGSNILAVDSSISKAVIKLTGEFDYIKIDGNTIEVGAGSMLSAVLNSCIRGNLSGLENLSGIPATIGGLIATNASAFGKDISVHLKEVELIDTDGKKCRIGKDGLSFSYRQSSLQGSIILRAWFVLSFENGIGKRVEDFLKKRYQKQDFNSPSCGCIFKNPDDRCAGELIDSCSLKGFSENDAQVSFRHANFIINLGHATYNDVDRLICEIKNIIKEKCGVVLQEEIERWI